jgi:hypothetical protein
MHDRIGLMQFEARLYFGPIGQIAFDENSLGMNGLAMALVQVVEDDVFVARCDQFTHDGAADVTGAARNKNFHELDRI